MNVGELLERVYQQAGTQDRFFVLSLLNEALIQLTDGAKLEMSASINFINGEAPLPAAYKAPVLLLEGTIGRPVQVYRLSHLEEPGIGYTIYGNTLYIKPADSKTLTFYYYQYAPALTDNADVPIIAGQWHYLLATYAAAMITLGKGLDKQMMEHLMEQWQGGRTQFLQSMQRERRKSRAREAVQW